MRIILGVGVALLLIFIGGMVLYWHEQNQRALPKHIQKTRERETAHPYLSFYDLSLKKKELTDFKGKVVLLNFWATWCAPCVEELPSLNRLAGHFPKKLILLALSNERTDEITNFLMAFPNFHPNFIIGNVGRKQMLSAFPVQAFPESYILNPAGQLIERVTGPQKWDSPAWKTKIKRFITN